MTTRPLYSFSSSCKMGAIFLQGMHVPAPKSKSFGRGLWTTSFGNRRSVEDCAKDVWFENKRNKRISNLIKEIKRKFCLFLFMGYFSSKARTIWPRTAWSSCGLRHFLRNERASSLSSSRRILFSTIVSSGLNFNINGWSMLPLPPSGSDESLASSIFLCNLTSSSHQNYPFEKAYTKPQRWALNDPGSRCPAEVLCIL